MWSHAVRTRSRPERGSNAGMHTRAGRVALMQRRGPKGENLAGNVQTLDMEWQPGCEMSCPPGRRGRLAGTWSRPAVSGPGRHGSYDHHGASAGREREIP